LDSLYNQKLSESILIEIIVVDNDVNETARDICRTYSDTDSIKLYYFTQPVKNISLTRNKAVQNAKGEFIFFIDDDTYAIDSWVTNLLKCLAEYKADAVFGAVVPYYENGVPDWVQKSNYFEKSILKTGSEPELVYTTNCVIKSELIKPLEEPFNPKCGLTGGEDGLFFGGLQKNGARFIFCSEAVVNDFVPVERGTLNYLFRRAFRRGITYSRHGIILSDFKIVLWFYTLFRSIAAVLISLLFSILLSPSEIRRNFWLVKMVGNLGHIAGLFNAKYKMYKK
jgi:succinoglycan biosynthesis protein ExoM